MKTILLSSIIKQETLPALIPSVAIATVVSIESVAGILVWLFIGDLLSGVFASYCTWREETAKGSWFFNWNSGGFSSDKFKKCFVKGIVYGGFPLIVLKFQQVFLLKNVSMTSITDAEIDITTICLLLFCANEIFSIFWENLPKCGLNLPKGIKSLITGVKEIKNT